MKGGVYCVGGIEKGEYRRAFFRNDKERYINYLERVNEGTAKMNTGVIYPYEIVASALKDEHSENDVRVLDTTWRALPNYCDGRNAIAVVDGSGSMYCYNEQPISAAMAWGYILQSIIQGIFIIILLHFQNLQDWLKSKEMILFQK